MSSMRWEFYYDDSDKPVGLIIWHDNQGTEVYDDDHTVMFDFREQQIIRPHLVPTSLDPLMIENELECICGFKCRIIDGEIEVTT